jgi:hypothetical protein
MFLRAALPEQHLSPESKDVVNLVMGLISIMSALVLGLLIAFAKSAYDTQQTPPTHPLRIWSVKPTGFFEGNKF